MAIAGITELPFVDTFKRDPQPPANDNLDPATKPTAKEMFLQKSRWLYAAYVRNDTMIPYAAAQEFQMNRLYAQGKQPNVKYMETLYPFKNKKGERKGFQNISWDNVAFYPKLREIMLGRLRKFDYAVSCNIVDEQAADSKATLKYMTWVEIQEKDFLDQVNEILGIPPDQQNGQTPQLPFKPSSLQDLDILAQTGSFKLTEELVYEKLLSKTHQLCEWDEIKNRLDEDAVDCGVIATKTFTDPVTNLPCVRYSDPAFLVVRHNRDASFNHITDAGEIIFMSTSQLREYGLSEDDITTAAKAYSGMWTNPAYQAVWPYNRQGYDMLGMFNIAVLDMDFESFDTYKYEYRPINGQQMPFKLPFDATGPSRSKNTYEVNKYGRRYRCKWVIGTDIIFDYGYQYDQVFDSENRPKSQFNVYRVADRPIGSRVISIIDDLQLLILKLRNAWAKARPSGIIIDWTALSNISIGDEKLSPKDVLSIFRNEGDIIYKPMLINGQPVIGGQPPIKETVGGLGPIANEFVLFFNLYVSQLREIAGLPAIVDSPSGDALVGVQKGAESANIDSMRSILMGYKRVKQRSFTNLCLMWQLLAQTKGVEQQYAGWDGGMEVLRLGWEAAGRPVEVVCEMLIDDTVRQTVLQAANNSLAAAKQGAVGITMADFFFIMNALEKGQILWAQTYLSYREQQKFQEQQQLQAQNMQLNQQGAIQQEQVKSQGQQEALAMEMKMEQAKGMTDIEAIKEKGRQDRLTLIYQSHLEKGLPVLPESEDILQQYFLQPALDAMVQQKMNEMQMQQQAAKGQGDNPAETLAIPPQGDAQS